ncbi:MAG TPA: VOC family protein [Acidobacteriaceae bacterium]|nr:VOC family protein [Acidobacteriaceae bacterium]
MATESETALSSRWSAAPYFIVDDVVATAHYYRDVLGFQFAQILGEPPCFTIVSRNGASIMLSQPAEAGHMRPNCTVDPEQTIWDAYLWIDAADALYAEYQQKGVTIIQPICNQPYGCREFTIRDCNGYTLGLGQGL